MLLEIEAKRELGGRVIPMYVETDYIAYIDEATVTIGLSTGKVIDVTEKTCHYLVQKITQAQMKSGYTQLWKKK